MSWKSGILVGVLLFGCIAWQGQALCSRNRRLSEVTAANTVLREQAAALIREREAADRALLTRERAHEGIETTRNAERAKAAATRGDDPDFRDWAGAHLPAGALGLLLDRGGEGTRAGDNPAETPGGAAVGHP